MDGVREIILNKIREQHLSMTEVSLKLGRNASYMQQFIRRGLPAVLREDDRLRLAAMLDVPEIALKGDRPAYGAKTQLIADTNVVLAGKRVALQAKNRVEPRHPPVILAGNGLPVFGSTETGPSSFTLTDVPVAQTARPDFLAYVRDAYAFYVAGDAMSPEAKRGRTAVVNPHLPATSGDLCLFRPSPDADDKDCKLFELVSIADELWTVHQHNPGKTLSLKRSKYPICHVVVAVSHRR